MNGNVEKPQNGYISVEEVLKYEYIIPIYQRGYRWDTDNVSKLLNDIYEDKCIDGKSDTIWTYAVSRKYNEIFNFKNDAIQNSKQAYCIQPLVVCSNRKGINKFDVIDGQQRLTTITIIICALRKICKEKNIVLQMPNIQLTYASRPDSRGYLEKLWNGEVSDCDSAKNVDFMYMKEAYKTALNFYEKELGQENCNCQEYAMLLQNILLKNTMFIWYCIDQDKMDPHEVFANFNSGKIELTNAELVKALFMDASNYDNVKNIRDIEDKRIVISEKWDEIETFLHNPDFWAFVPHRNQYGDGNYDTRIDVIFEMFIMMHHINNKSKTIDDYIDYRKSKNRDRYIFDEMESFIKGELGQGKGGSKNEIMQKCWGEIRKVYLGLQELYQVDTLGNNNNKIYNMVGLYINLANRIPGRVDAYLYDNDEQYLRIYYNLAEVMKTPRFGKDNRKTKLQLLIKKEIGLTEDIEGEIKKIRHSVSNEAGGAVNKDADRIVKILLAYNIGLLNNSGGIGQRFDFRAFANITWQREHIFATNMDEIKNQQEGLDIDEERMAALKILSEEIQMKESIYENKYIEYVKNVYFYGQSFPPKFKYENDDVELDFENELQVKTFINNNLSKEGTGPFSMLARALDTYNKCVKMKQFYDNLEQIKNAQTYDDEDIKRQMYFRILKDLGKDFYTREYVDIGSKVEEALVSYPNMPQYIIQVGEWSRTISDNTKDKWDLIETERSAYSDYVRALYMENKRGSGRADDYEVKKYEDINKWEDLKEVFRVCEQTLQENIKTFFSKEFTNLLADNTMGNMTLLTGGNKADEKYQKTNQNQLVTNKSFKLKKQMIHKFFQKGEFVPLGTVLVFSDAYNDSANTANFWLPDSRIRYLDHMISTVKIFLQNEEN